MITKSRTLWCLSVLLVFLVWPLAADAYEEIVITNGATIRGTVRFQGDVPKLMTLDVSRFKDICMAVPDETLVVGPDKGVRYAVVTLEGITKGKGVEREVQHELDNINCRFVPHVQAASVGQFVLLKNTDPILHTAHAYFPSGQPHFNVGLFPGRVSRKPLITPGVVKILCEVHPWMSAYIVVTEHPYHAVTDVYGEYLITDIPAGAYRLRVWHETLGTEEKQIKVDGGGSHRVDFVLSVKTGPKK